MDSKSKDALKPKYKQIIRPDNVIPEKLLYGLFSKPETSDFKVVEENTFHAHRIIIGLHTDFFKKALEGGFRESVDNKVQLPEHDECTVYYFLLYCYTGDYPSKTKDDFYAPMRPISLDKANKDSMVKHVRVYALADFLDMPDLKKLAAAKFKNVIQKDLQKLEKEVPNFGGFKVRGRGGEGGGFEDEKMAAGLQSEESSHSPHSFKAEFMEGLREIISTIPANDRMIYSHLATALGTKWNCIANLYGVKELIFEQPQLMWDILQKAPKPRDLGFGEYKCKTCSARLVYVQCCEDRSFRHRRKNPPASDWEDSNNSYTDNYSEYNSENSEQSTVNDNDSDESTHHSDSTEN